MRRSTFVCASAAIVLAASGCRDDDLSVVPGGVVGRVCDEESGRGISGATVKLTTEAGKEDEAVATADGSYVFASVAPGTVTITAQLEVPRTFETEVTSGADAVITDPACRAPPGVPEAGGVIGEVCNRHTGELVQDAQVIVQVSTGEVFVTRTDDQGAFELQNLPEGEHILTVQGAGFQRSFAISIVAGELFELPLAEECIETDASHGTLSGALCDPSNPSGALVGARVTATDSTGFTVSDITDTDGGFFLNALAPGPAQVEVARDPDLNEFYAVDVVAGADTTVAYDLTCNAQCLVDIAIAPTVGSRPVDIIFAVDTSGSMDDDRDAVQSNLNNFSSQIAASGVDYRVIMIGEVNVPAPLGGSAEYLHIDAYVGSHSALSDYIQYYAQYSSFLREDSVKHFVVVTDDESDLSSGQFASTVATWGGFEGYKFHSIASFGNEDDGCSTGAGYSHQYVNLSEATGGLMSQICGANYAQVFDALLEAVTIATLPCTIDVPSMPSGQVLDTSRVSVAHNGVTTDVDASSSGACAGSGWQFDSVTSPTQLVACADTCTALTTDGDGSLLATFGCHP